MIQAKALSKSFVKDKTEIQVLKNIDFELKEKEMVAITGASGAGKSTLLHVLGTLEPPTSGEVLFGPDRLNVFQFNETQLSEFRNQSLGFIFQFHYLLPEFSALENVMMPALIAKQDRAKATQEAKRLLEFVGLEKRLEHRPHELSGGEQQRVAIARAVILKPKLLFADELTGNLDSDNSKRVIAHLKQLHEATGISVLLVTHDPEIAKQMQRVYVMQDGQLKN